MSVTVVSHRYSQTEPRTFWCLSEHGEVTTTSDPINYIYPSVKLVDSVTNPYPEDWRLKVQPDEQQYTGDLQTIDLLYEKTPQYFVNKYQNVLSKLQINPDILNFVDNFTFPGRRW